MEKVVFYALGAGGRRFESFCPDKLKMRELRAFATPSIFWKNQNLHSICTQTFENGHKFDFDFLVEFHVFREQNDTKKAAPFEAAHANIEALTFFLRELPFFVSVLSKVGWLFVSVLSKTI